STGRAPVTGDELDSRLDRGRGGNGGDDGAVTDDAQSDDARQDGVPQVVAHNAKVQRDSPVRPRRVVLLRAFDRHVERVDIRASLAKDLDDVPGRARAR